MAGVDPRERWETGSSGAHRGDANVDERRLPHAREEVLLEGAFARDHHDDARWARSSCRGCAALQGSGFHLLRVELPI
eukprot:804291-Pleurochrysis_carterae.AAC.4